jgi:hypothetical protein
MGTPSTQGFEEGEPAQSQDGISMAPSDDGFAPIEVDAPRTIVPNQTYLPADLTSSFGCGAFTCSYQMGQFHSGVYRGVWFNVNLLGNTGSGHWVQSFINSDTGQFQPDWSSNSGTPFPAYPTDYSNGNWFFDDPAGQLGSAKTWVAQTSYVLPSGSSAFTIMWGYQLNPNGVAGYIPPMVVAPWGSQQQLLGH